MSAKKLNKGFINSTIVYSALILCGVSTGSAGPPNHFASSDQALQVVRHNQGRRAGSSNRAVVPVAPVLPANGLHFELDSRGVYLIWETEQDPAIRSSLVKFDYHIYRREKGSAKRVAVPYLRAVVHTQEGERWSAVDMSIEWEKTYLYSVTPVTRLYSQGGHLISEIEGAGSPPIRIITHDVFPPAVPERVLPIVGHVAGGKFVDLLWAPNTEKDIFGYNVYRREEGGQPARVNSAPITVLSFQDMDVSAGHNYFYCISAVDLRGNESTRSAETTAVAP